MENKALDKTETGLNELMLAAANGTLPREFSDWSPADRDGKTVAHVAAENGNLPLTVNSVVWALKDIDGWTVAHAAMELPEDFDGWDWADNEGWTVAHAAAVRGGLPDHYGGWHTADRLGFTVAHAAASMGNLPDPFSDWDLTTISGRTVAQEAIERGTQAHLVPDEYKRKSAPAPGM